ncbi:MAG: bifunctional 4-hydroxy-2-oxoglutarate aldolase/2-dehydro-3-deoxy-phosphogluconate aldolase [Eubacterium sp.]
MKVLDKIKACGIVPVVIIEDADKAKALGRSVLYGGLNCIEITFRTKAAAKAIEIIKKEYPEMTVGAGTVLTIEQVKIAAKAGAEFIVSPGSNPKVIQYCQDNNICVIPGVVTPSEIEKNLDMGITTMKFFPAEAAGGLKMIRAMSAPYGAVSFMPTGGINVDNVREYLKYNKIIACGGSWIVKSDLLEKNNYEEIAKLSREAADIVKQVR